MEENSSRETSRGRLRAILGVLSLSMLVAVIVGGTAADWLFGLGAAWFPLLLIVLGAPHLLGPAHRGTLVVLGISWSLTAALVLSGVFEGRRWAGLPVGTWAVVLAFGLLPLVLVSLAHGKSERDERGGRTCPVGRPE